MKKEITLLHANDIHGQLFFTVNEECEIMGGISLLSGYVKKTRAERPTFFGICGDVLQEDIWGSDYKGTNTVELINYIKPDALSLGNHELDYGIAHLLIFKECVEAPTLCANLNVSYLGQKLFKPSLVYDIDGVKILFIGVLPKAFFNKIMSDEFCRNSLTYVETYDAIREEIRAHEDEHIDLTVLMSHYGIEGDRTLAENMPEDIHIDLILGGHSHINMDEAEVIGGIPIAQSSYGTTHIGRFDLTVDTDRGGICDWKWERVELSEKVCDFDLGVDELADRIVFKTKPKTDNELICRFKEQYEHKSRVLETQLGDIIADTFAKIYPVDFTIIQSGSLRRTECGPEVTEKDLSELYPFDDRFVMVDLTGKEIREAFEYLFSLKPDGSVMNGTFQYSEGFRLVVDADDCWNKGCRIEELSFKGKPFEDDKTYRVGMTRNCANSTFRYFSIVLGPERQKTVSLSTYNELASYFLKKPEPIEAPKQGRFVMKNFKG
ncbi:MAG: bifunctional metallophosphatase/5'-nucleotidase [Lachnospiraceae bacterium]|nr:bifunctional metallophosphatase/5'-nucleotidase [Lachnospiraceae bacterium]